MRMFAGLDAFNPDVFIIVNTLTGVIMSPDEDIRIVSRSLIEDEEDEVEVVSVAASQGEPLYAHLGVVDVEDESEDDALWSLRK